MRPALGAVAFNKALKEKERVLLIVQRSVQLLPTRRFMGGLIQETATALCGFCHSGNDVGFVLRLLL